MRTGMMRTSERRAILLPLLLLLVCHAGSAIGQALGTAYGEERRPWIAMIVRVDPLDPTRYVGVTADEQSQVVAFFRGGQRMQLTLPHVLERDDEFETARDVMAVIRYPIGDVYVDAGTRVRIGSLDVLFGRIFAKVKGFFSVENQNVVAGVEGTEFAFEVARDGSTEITVLDGAVLSSSKRLPWKPLRVTRDQAFWVTNAGMQIKVGAAPPTQLAQLRRWVDRADNAVAVFAPRVAQPPPRVAQTPPPEPQPQQPVPPSMQPVPQPLQPGPSPTQTIIPPVITLQIPIVTDPTGYCCDATGQVYPSTAGACRGRLYQYRADANAQCGDRRGFCCANNRVFETVPSQCTGVFSYNQKSVAEGCSTKGYCCVDRKLAQTTQDRCKGTFYTDATIASHSCTGEGPEPGYCCVGGQLSRVDRQQCGGKYYPDAGTARKACRPPVVVGPNSGAPSKGKTGTTAPKSDGIDKSKVVTTPNPNAGDKSKAVITAPKSNVNSKIYKKDPDPVIVK